MILAIDTSLGSGAALVDAAGTVLGEAWSDDPLAHAEVIGELLSRVLATGEAPTHVAAGMGPGPFTGLRIGIVAARTFAQARGLPLVPVASHDAVALEVLTGAPGRSVLAGDAASGTFAVVTDARRREFAFSVYDGLDLDGLPYRIVGPTLAHRDEIDERLAALGAVRVDAAAISTAALGVVAARAVAAGRSIASPEPLYLRAPDVTMPGAPKKVRS